jgi:hypothetical protein
MKVFVRNKLFLIFFVFLFFGASPLKALYPMTRNLLITGCARSGTGYISQVLTRAGLDIRHEQIGKDGTSAWVMVAPSEKTPWGPGRKNIRFIHIFHQVRDPLKTISSVFSTEPPASWQYIMEYVPQILPEDSKTVKAAKYWYYWNLKAAELAEWTYRIEDIREVWGEMQYRLGKNLDMSVLDHVSKKANTRGNHMRDFTWEDLRKELEPNLYRNIRALARSYGYIN